MKKSNVLISGHRGTRLHAIENTKAAFEYCLKNKFDYVEFDVRLTKDDALVVFHDKTVDKLLNGSGAIEDLLLSEILELKYADGQHVLTLEEFFILVGKKIRPMLEIKTRNCSRQVIDSVHKFGYENYEIMIISFNLNDIRECHRIDPQYDYGLIVGAFLKFPIFRRLSAIIFYSVVFKPNPFITEVNANGINYYDEIIELMSEHGINITLGAKNTEKYLNKLETWNVKIINCDDGTAIRKLLA